MVDMRVLVLGASGYLGRHLVTELHRRDHEVTAVVRDRGRAESTGPWGAWSLTGQVTHWRIGQVTDPGFAADLAAGIDVVVSALGVTRQKADPWEIDYRANLMVLASAQRHRATSFCYVNAVGAEHGPAQITRAKTAFAKKLAHSSLTSQIVNPSAYFSDMLQILQMAHHGRVYLLNPQARITPIHPGDLATACVDRIESGQPCNDDVGGPEEMTWRQAAETAFSVLGTSPRVTRLPQRSLDILAWPVSLVSRRTADVLRFVSWAMREDSVAVPTGHRRLANFFTEQLQNTCDTTRGMMPP